MRINYKIDWHALGDMNGSKKLSNKKYSILEGALKVVSKRGIQGLSVTSLSKECGLSKPLLLYHYESMELVLEDLYFYITKLLEYFYRQSYDQESSFEENISAITVSAFKWSLFNRDVAQFFCLMPHIGKSSQGLKKTSQFHHEMIQTQYEKIFLESMRFNSIETVKISVHGVKTMTFGTLNEMIAKGDILDHEDYAQILKFNLEQFLQVELPRFLL
ncbi:MAG: hypothetical protein CME63_08810 [Halobacteriovoraceae bacterium]|nr:hypothetical protein [Halobacteriovoraceae bacterium]|tara:strand:- start:22616 stop:23266 length:651 start_codon:yes stop_codon:yes gene_type:complete